MNFNKTATSWIEVFCAYVINKNIFPFETLYVGDCGDEHLPDIYNISKTLGIEVVQLERDSDLDAKYLYEIFKENNGNFQKVKEICDIKFPHTYELTENNGKLVAFSTTDGTHSIDWMKDTYSKNINNKLRKLNNGNYSGIDGQLILCTSIIYRFKGLYDAFLILYSYLEAVTKYRRAYDKLIVITSSEIFIFEPHKVKNISPIIHQGKICDFFVEGVDYLKKFNYDYSDYHKLTSNHFST